MSAELVSITGARWWWWWWTGARYSSVTWSSWPNIYNYPSMWNYRCQRCYKYLKTNQWRLELAMDNDYATLPSTLIHWTRSFSHTPDVKSIGPLFVSHMDEHSNRTRIGYGWLASATHIVGLQLMVSWQMYTYSLAICSMYNSLLCDH